MPDQPYKFLAMLANIRLALVLVDLSQVVYLAQLDMLVHVGHILRRVVLLEPVQVKVAPPAYHVLWGSL